MARTSRREADSVLQQSFTDHTDPIIRRLGTFLSHERDIVLRFISWTPQGLTMRWSERRTAVRSTFEMTSTLQLRATHALVRRRSSCSR